MWVDGSALQLGVRGNHTYGWPSISGFSHCAVMRSSIPGRFVGSTPSAGPGSLFLLRPHVEFSFNTPFDS